MTYENMATVVCKTETLLHFVLISFCVMDPRMTQKEVNLATILHMQKKPHHGKLYFYSMLQKEI